MMMIKRKVIVMKGGDRKDEVVERMRWCNEVRVIIGIMQHE